MDLIVPSNTSKSASYTGTAGSTDAFAAWETGVLVWTTTDAHVKIGAGVTATTADTPVPAFTPIAFKVPQENAAWRVSAIQISAGGIVYAMPIGG